MPTRNFYDGDCHVVIMTLHDKGYLSEGRHYLRYGKIIYMKRQIKRRYLSIHIPHACKVRGKVHKNRYLQIHFLNGSLQSCCYTTLAFSHSFNQSHIILNFSKGFSSSSCLSGSSSSSQSSSKYSSIGESFTRSQVLSF